MKTVTAAARLHYVWTYIHFSLSYIIITIIHHLFVIFPPKFSWTKRIRTLQKLFDWLMMWSISLLSSQTHWLSALSQKLWSSVLSSQLPVLQSDTSGPEWQRPAGFRSELSFCWTEESKLHTGDSQVSSLLSFHVFESICYNFNLPKKFFSLFHWMKQLHLEKRSFKNIFLGRFFWS